MNGRWITITLILIRETGMDVPVDQGLLIVEVVPGSPAATAGIRGGDRVVRIGNARIPLGGDIIVALGGEPIANREELIVYLETQTQVGDTVEMTIIRDGKEQNVRATLAERLQ